MEICGRLYVTTDQPVQAVVINAKVWVCIRRKGHPSDHMGCDYEGMRLGLTGSTVQWWPDELG
jgi:hypothetical protein